MEPNSTLGEPIGVVHVTINGQKVPANVYADRTCIMPDGTIRKVKQEVVDALLAKKRAAEIPAQTPAQQAPVAQPFITRVQSQPVVQPVQPAAPQPAVQTPQTTMQYGVSAHGVSPAQAPGYQVPVTGSVEQPSQATASVPYIPDPNELPDQMTATRQTMVAQELMQQEANEAAKKRFGLGQKGKACKRRSPRRTGTDSSHRRACSAFAKEKEQQGHCSNSGSCHRWRCGWLCFRTVRL